MKKTSITTILLISLLSICSCVHQELEIPLPQVSLTDSVIPDYTSVSITCWIRGNLSAEQLIVEYSTDNSFSTSQRVEIAKNGDSFRTTLKGLVANKVYYYRYTISNKISTFTDKEVYSFSTLAYSAPSISTLDVRDISEYNATVIGRIDNIGGKPILEKGFYVGKDKNNLQKFACDGSQFSYSLSGLDNGTTYYYQAYARNEKGVGTGDVLSFNTQEFNPENYLTFEVVTGGSITWTATGSTYKTIEYSKDRGKTWTSITSTKNGVSIPISSGNTLYFRGDNASYSSGIQNYNRFGVTDGATFYAYGPVTSLLSQDKRESLMSYALSGLFRDCTGLLSHKTNKLILPSITLGILSYSGMFSGCTSLTSAPELPAKQLAENCYNVMFSDCTSLTSAPELPATTLASSCYSGMFSGCTSLTSAPELPATMLDDFCYNGMFFDCTSLTSAPELPATSLATACYSVMFVDCTSLTSAPELPATTLASSCYSGMFSGCTSLTSAPELPAKQLAESCYGGMFSGCTSLTSAPELPAKQLAENCYNAMFSDCTSLTSAPELPATTLASSCYSGMFSWCTSLVSAPELPAIQLAEGSYRYMFFGCSSLSYVKCLATDISAESSTYDWLAGVPSTGSFICPESMTAVWPRGNSGIPTGWEIYDSDKPYYPVTGVTLNKTTLSLNVGDTQTLTATISPSNATNKSVSWSTTNSSIATVSSSGVVTAKAAGTATITVKTSDGEKTANCTVSVTSQIPDGAVDLGLPSGLKWASCNLGATKPEEYGDYYAWGETEPYYINQNPLKWKLDKYTGYTWESYKWCKGGYSAITKYCNNASFGYDGFTDTKLVLNSEDDAAHVNLSGNWRIPTDAEWAELIENCTWTWTTQNGVNGMLATASNGNSIFLPAAGNRGMTSLVNAGSNGHYWSSSLYLDNPSLACDVHIDSFIVHRYQVPRSAGHSIRPVSD